MNKARQHRMNLSGHTSYLPSSGAALDPCNASATTQHPRSANEEAEKASEMRCIPFDLSGPSQRYGSTFEKLMNTQGEMEAGMCDVMNRFAKEYTGRGPKAIHAHLIGDVLMIRLMGVLSAAEQHLIKIVPIDKGKELLKQVRFRLIETARPVLEAIILDITGVKVLSLHHDISTVTGEELVVFTLARPPHCRELRTTKR